MNQIKLSGPEVAPASGAKPTQLIVFLHGVGADGNDLISFADEMAADFPDAHFISPNGPFPYDMAPYGRQWFSLIDRTREKMLAGAKAAAPIVNNFLDDQLKRFGLEDKNLALVGFSQGTMMSLYASLRRAKPVAAVVGYSGAFIHVEDLAGEIKSKPPICLIHGTHDQVVPLAALHHATVELKFLGINIEGHERPGLGHGVDPEGISIGLDFLHKHLKG